MILTKEQILSAQDIKTVTISVPEWGGEVIVRSLSGTERYRLMSAIYKAGKNTVENVKVAWVAASIIGEDGKQLFTEADIDALGNKSAIALDRVAEQVEKLNALSSDSVDKLEKN